MVHGALEIGSRVRIHSLPSKPELNRRQGGVVEAEVKGKERWGVEGSLEGGTSFVIRYVPASQRTATLSLKPTCLTSIAKGVLGVARASWYIPVTIPSLQQDQCDPNATPSAARTSAPAPPALAAAAAESDAAAMLADHAKQETSQEAPKPARRVTGRGLVRRDAFKRLVRRRNTIAAAATSGGCDGGGGECGGAASGCAAVAGGTCVCPASAFTPSMSDGSDMGCCDSDMGCRDSISTGKKSAEHAPFDHTIKRGRDRRKPLASMTAEEKQAKKGAQMEKMRVSARECRVRRKHSTFGASGSNAYSSDTAAVEAAAAVPAVTAAVVVVVEEPRSDPPIFKLTADLIKTYKEINRKYYKAKGKRKHAQAKEASHYTVVKGERLGVGVKSSDQFMRYEVEKKLGSGSFGTVVAAVDTQGCRSGTEVAIKVVRKELRFLRQAKIEATLLKELKRKAPGLTLDLLDDFEWNGHKCFVFERGQMNLYNLLGMTRFKGFALEVVAGIGRQLVVALNRLAQTDLQLIHADLKPENIMIQADAAQIARTLFPDSGTGASRSSSGGGGKAEDSIKVRIIDFGSSCKVGKTVHTYVQSRHYRSPEVVLKLPYDGKIDVWSLGCVLYELYTGKTLFSAKSSAEHIYQIREVFGDIPTSMLTKARQSTMFNADTGKPTDAAAAARAARSRCAKSPLASIFASSPSAGSDEEAFAEVLESMLAVDPDVRLNPKTLLAHPFFSNGGGGGGNAADAVAAQAAEEAAAPSAAASMEAQPWPSFRGPITKLSWLDLRKRKSSSEGVSG